jgi:WD40 repeat protein
MGFFKKLFGNANQPTGSLVKLEEHPAGLDIFTMGTNIVASTTEKGKEIFIWDAATGDQKGSLKGHAKKINNLAFTKDGSLLLSASEDKTIRVWDVLDLKEIKKIPFTRAVKCMACDLKGERAFIGADDNRIHVLDLINGKESSIIPIGEKDIKTKDVKKALGDINEIASSSDGTQIAALYTEWPGIICWRLGETTKITLVPSSFKFFSLCFSANDDFIIACGGAFSLQMDGKGNLSEITESNLGGAVLIKQTGGAEGSETAQIGGIFYSHCGWMADTNEVLILATSPPFKNNNLKKAINAYEIEDIFADELKRPKWKNNLLPGFLIEKGTFSSTGSFYGMKLNDTLHIWQFSKR